MTTEDERNDERVHETQLADGWVVEATEASKINLGNLAPLAVGDAHGGAMTTEVEMLLSEAM